MASGLPLVGVELVALGAATFNRNMNMVMRDIVNLSRTNTALAKMGTEDWGQLGQAMNGAALVAGAATATIIAGISAVIGKSTELAAAFEQSTTAAAVLANGTEQNYKDMQAGILELTRSTTTRIGGLTDIMGQLSRSGISVEDAVNGAARAVNNLVIASAGEVDIQRATLAVAGAMNAFGLAGSEADRVVNALGTAALKSAITFGDVQRSFQQAVAGAAMLHYSVEDLSAAIGILGLAGMRGSDAGTSLKQMFISLLKPSKQALAMMQEYGIALFDAQGRALPLRNVIANLSAAFGDQAIAAGKLSEAQRANALAVIFGSDAIRAATLLAQYGTKAYDDFINAMEHLSMAKMAEQILRPTSSQFGIFRNQVEAAATALGEDMNTALGKFMRSINTVLRAGLPTEYIKGFSQALASIVTGVPVAAAEIYKLTDSPLQPVLKAWSALCLSLNDAIFNKVLPSIVLLFKTISGGRTIGESLVLVFQKLADAITAGAQYFSTFVRYLSAVISYFKQTEAGALALKTVLAGIITLPFLGMVRIIYGILKPFFLLSTTALAASVAIYTIPKAISDVINILNSSDDSVTKFVKIVTNGFVLASVASVLFASGLYKRILPALAFTMSKGLIPFTRLLTVGLAKGLVGSVSYLIKFSGALYNLGAAFIAIARGPLGLIGALRGLGTLTNLMFAGFGRGTRIAIGAFTALYNGIFRAVTGIINLSVLMGKSIVKGLTQVSFGILWVADKSLRAIDLLFIGLSKVPDLVASAASATYKGMTAFAIGIAKLPTLVYTTFTFIGVIISEWYKTLSKAFLDLSVRIYLTASNWLNAAGTAIMGVARSFATAIVNVITGAAQGVAAVSRSLYASVLVSARGIGTAFKNAFTLIGIYVRGFAAITLKSFVLVRAGLLSLGAALTVTWLNFKLLVRNIIPVLNLLGLSIVNALAPTRAVLARFVSDMAWAARQAIVSARLTMASWGQSLARGIGNTIAAIRLWLAGLITSFITTVRSANILPRIGAFFTGLAQGVVRGIARAITAIGRFIAAQAVMAAASLKQFAVQKLVWIAGIAGTVVRAVGTVLAAIAPVLAVLAALGLAAYGLYYAWTTNFLGIKDFVGKVINFIVEKLNAFFDFLSGLPVVGEALNWVRRGLSDIAETAGTEIPKAIDTVKSAFNGLKDNAIDAFGKIKSEAEKQLPGVMEFLGLSLPNMDEQDKQWQQSIKDIEQYQKQLDDLGLTYPEVAGGAGSAADETLKFKLAVAELTKLLPIATRDLIDFLAGLAQADPARLAPMVSTLYTSSGILKQLIAQKQALLQIDMQIVQAESRIAIIEAEIAVKEAAYNASRLSTDLELLRLRYQQAAIEQQMLPYRQQEAAIDKQIAALQATNYDLEIKKAQIQLQMLPYEQQIAAIEKQIAATQRVNYALALQRAQAVLEEMPAQRELVLIQRQMEDIGDRRYELAMKEKQLIADSALAQMQKDLKSTTKALDQAWSNMDVDEIIRLEALKAQQEQNVADQQDAVDAIRNEQDEYERRNELAKIGLEYEQIALEEVIKQWDRKIEDMDYEKSLQEARNEIVRLGLEKEKQSLQDILDTYQNQLDIIDAIIERSTRENAIVILGLQQQRDAVEQILQGLQDQYDAIGNTISALELQQQAAEVAYQQSIAQYQQELALEQQKRAELLLTSLQQQNAMTIVAAQFIALATASGAYTVAEAAEVLKRLNLWNDQLDKIAEVWGAYDTLTNHANVSGQVAAETAREIAKTGGGSGGVNDAASAYKELTYQEFLAQQRAELLNAEVYSTSEVVGPIYNTAAAFDRVVKSISDSTIVVNDANTSFGNLSTSAQDATITMLSFVDSSNNKMQQASGPLRDLAKQYDTIGLSIDEAKKAGVGFSASTVSQSGIAYTAIGTLNTILGTVTGSFNTLKEAVSKNNSDINKSVDTVTGKYKTLTGQVDTTTESQDTYYNKAKEQLPATVPLVNDVSNSYLNVDTSTKNATAAQQALTDTTTKNVPIILPQVDSISTGYGSLKSSIDSSSASIESFKAEIEATTGPILNKIGQVIDKFNQLKDAINKAKEAVSDLSNEIRNIPDKTVNVKVNYDKSGTYQHGGVVPGKYGEPVPIIAHAGERFLGINNGTPTGAKVSTSQARPVQNVTNNTSYNVNANYSRVQSAASVAMDMRAMVGMTRR